MATAPKDPAKQARQERFNDAIQQMLGGLRHPDPRQDKYRHKIQAPALPKGVVPQGADAPCLAADSYALHGFMGDHVHIHNGFPGYTRLAMLATMPEYRAFASSLSTELFREGVTIKATSESASKATKKKVQDLTERFEEMKILEIMRSLSENDTYFGRGQMYVGIKGADDELPLIIDPVTIPKGSLTHFTSVEPMWSTPSAYNSLDPRKTNFYKPAEWFLMGYRVHASRVIGVVTRPVPDMLKPAYNFSGMSLSQLAEPYVDNWLRTRSAIGDLISNFSTTALKTDMAQMLQDGCDDDEGSLSLMKRIELFCLLRSNKGVMLMDHEVEDLVQLNVPLSGLSDLQAQSQEHMCSVSRIPAIILTGISPSGLNATSEGEIAVFEDWIMAQLEAHYKHPLDIVLKIMQLDMYGKIDPNITFEFNPLKQMTPKELAEIEEINSRTATTYVDASVVTPQEVRQKLATDKNSQFSGLDTSIEAEDELTPPEGENPDGLPPANDPMLQQQQPGQPAPVPKAKPEDQQAPPKQELEVA